MDASPALTDRSLSSTTLAEDTDGTTLNEPTNCCFGGPDFDRLYVSNLGGNHLAALDLRVKGQKLYSHHGE